MAGKRKTADSHAHERMLCCECGFSAERDRYIAHLGAECKERKERNRRERGEPKTLPMKGHYDEVEHKNG